MRAEQHLSKLLPEVIENYLRVADHSVFERLRGTLRYRILR